MKRNDFQFFRMLLDLSQQKVKRGPGAMKKLFKKHRVSRRLQKHILDLDTKAIHKHLRSQASELYEAARIAGRYILSPWPDEPADNIIKDFSVEPERTRVLTKVTIHLSVVPRTDVDPKAEFRGPKGAVVPVQNPKPDKKNKLVRGTARFQRPGRYMLCISMNSEKEEDRLEAWGPRAVEIEE